MNPLANLARRARLVNLAGSSFLLLGGLGALSALPSLSSCKKDKAEDVPPPEVVDAAAIKVPPVDSVTTGLQAIDAAAPSDLDNKTPFEQGQIYFSQGEYWKARLMVEKTALADNATKDQTELLVKICLAQDDAVCIEKCAKKLGRKIKMNDGKTPPASGSNASPATEPGAKVGDEHKEPDTELAHVRDLVLKNKLPEARKALEPKVIGGSASSEETRLLRTICKMQNDKMCVALCDAKLQ